jgi:hypothetical protein
VSKLASDIKIDTEKKMKGDGMILKMVVEFDSDTSDFTVYQLIVHAGNTTIGKGVCTKPQGRKESLSPQWLTHL